MTNQIDPTTPARICPVCQGQDIGFDTMDNSLSSNQLRCHRCGFEGITSEFPTLNKDGTVLETLIYACPDCRGTGIYRKSMDDGAGIVCSTCKGEAKIVLEYTPFTERVLRDDIEFVRYDTNTAARQGYPGGQIPYSAFLAGQMPDRYHEAEDASQP